MVRGLSSFDNVEQFYDVCVLTKQRRLLFPQQSSFRAKERLELVHGDLCGPVTPATPGGWRYFLLLVDDLSRYMWVVVLGSKGEAANAITRAQAAAEVECGHKLRVQPAAEWRRRAAQPDGCGDGSGPPQAGGMPAVFWGEAVVTAVYILNHSPIKALNGRTLYEACMGTSRRSHLWVFG
jgi:hypothetical protein